MSNSNAPERRQFSSLSSSLDARLLRALATLSFTHQTPVQAAALPPALQGKDILARARTGSGKTLAYGIPILQHILTAKSALQPTDVDFHATRGLILVPTRELSQQVASQLAKVSAALEDDALSVLNVSGPNTGSNKKQRGQQGDRVQRMQLADKPDIVVSTPSRVLSHLRAGALDLSKLEALVIDEADLILSYGHSSNDIQAILTGSDTWSLPTTYQSFLMSATMTGDVEELQGVVLRNPEVLLLEDDEDSYANLSQYAVRCTEEDKFLLIYVLFKLKLIKGKVLVFVNSVDRGYRLKLFLEKFGIRSGVLNAELPFNSRYHSVMEFNRGVFDYLIATDEAGAAAPKEAEERDEKSELLPTQPEASTSAAATPAESSSKSLKRKRKADKPDSSVEYGVSRGVDFVDVSCVLNFDLPASTAAYTHRIGRTARAGRTGMALSFVVPKAEWGKQKHGDISLPSARQDEKIWKRIEKDQSSKGGVKEYKFDMDQVGAFRYRMEDGLRAVTRATVKEARIKEIKQEVLNSEKLKAHFEENPTDLAFLRHDKPLHPSRTPAHLKHVPNYLLPRMTTVGPAGSPAAEQSVSEPVAAGSQSGQPRTPRVSFHKSGGGRGGSARGRGRGGRGGSRGGKSDPLKKFSFKRH